MTFQRYQNRSLITLAVRVESQKRKLNESGTQGIKGTME